MSKFDEILNSSDASDALLGEQIDKLQPFFKHEESDRIETPWDTIPTDGCFLFNIRLSVNSQVFVANISAPRSGFINQYFTAIARYGGKNHTFTGYVSFTLSDRKLIAALQNCELDGTATEAPAVTRLACAYTV